MRQSRRTTCVLFLVSFVAVCLSTGHVAAQDTWAVKVIAKGSGMPVPGADITIYPGGKDKGADNKHLFTTDASGRANIPVIHYEKTAPNDFANIIVEYAGERRAHVFCGPETLRGDQKSTFVLPLSESRRVDDSSKVTLQMAVSDFRDKERRKYWQIRVSGMLPDVETGAAEWWSYLEPVEEEGERIFRGDVPLGLQQARLHLDSRSGVALMYEDADESHYYCQPSVPLGTIGETSQLGRLHLYHGGSVVVNVRDSEGNVVNDARVDGFIRSSVVKESYAKFAPLRRGTEGKYVSPPMTNLAVAAIRVIHPVYPEAKLETKAVRRGERMEVDVTLKSAEPTEQKDDANALPDFVRDRGKMEILRPGTSIPEWPLGTVGPTRSGLRAALKLDPEKDAYVIGDTVKCWFVIQNASDRAIEFSTQTYVQEANAEAYDQGGDPVRVSTTWYSGMTPHAHYRLAPGEQVEVRASDLGIGKFEYEHPVGMVVESNPGDTCRLRLQIKIPGVQSSGGDGVVSVPARGEWIGRLRTGEVQFRVMKKD